MHSKSLLVTLYKTITPLFIFFYSCNAVVSKGKISQNQDDIRCFKVTQNFPMINNKGKLVAYDTMVAWVYYRKNQILYHSAYDFYLDTIQTPEVRYRYFVYTNGNIYGSLFDKSKSEFNKNVLVDSVLKTEWTMQFSFYPFTNYNVKLISVNKKSTTETIEEIYSFKGIKDSSISGTFDFIFSNRFKKGGFSLSKQLDSIKNMKLYKVRIINNSRDIKEEGIILDRIEQAWDLEEVFIKNYDEISMYFDMEKRNSYKN